MTTPLLTTKLYIPPVRPGLVSRPRLIERLNDGLHRKLTLISAPAGFGKTTLVSEWVQAMGGVAPPVAIAWLSLDESDNDSARFLSYFIAALRTIETRQEPAAQQEPAGLIAKGALSALQSPQPPSAEAILTALINGISAIPDWIVLVLDDYHLIEAQPIHDALTFLLKHLPPNMHLVIATRENPPLALARLRTQGQLTELRVADLRFTSSEAAGFLNQVMGLNLSTEDIAALGTRTEGWIAGLQLAALALQGALSMQGHQDATSFIKSFAGSHHFVMDYLVEEVLHQQSASVQTFLLRTSILDRLCGPLCDAILYGDADLHSTPTVSGQETLEYLERANLFIVPLDNERRWYRYHHLFADLLRQRLQQSIASSTGDEGRGVAEYHIRASEWYEENGLEFEAFHHAAAAHDVVRAERLIEGKGMPLHFRGAVTAILDWLASLPKTVKDARPSLWVKTATLSLVAGQTTGVEEKLRAAETALAGSTNGPDDRSRDLIGIIAAARATLALTQYQAETIIAQSRRALEYLRPDNLPFRFTAMWTLAVAHQLQGDRAAAGRALTEASSISQASGDIFSTVLAIDGLGEVQALENRLHLAAEFYRRVLQLTGEQPQPNAGEAHLGLARIYYEWNDLEAAEQHGQQSLQLLRQYDRVIDRFILSEVFLARLKLAQGDEAGATAMLAEADQSARRYNFVHRMPEIAAVQVLVLLCQGDLAEAAHLAQTHELPLSQARVHLARGDPSTALTVLEPWRQQVETKGWQDERLKVMVLQAVALHAAALQADGEKEEAVQLLADALALAEPGGFIRLFVDEGSPMAQLLSEAAAHRIMSDYVGKLLAAFEAEEQESKDKSYLPLAQPLIEPLSQRELEVLQLIAQGLSNREISERLFLALSTVKGHNRRIYGKLQVKRRTEAVARARELGLL